MAFIDYYICTDNGYTEREIYIVGFTHQTYETRSWTAQCSSPVPTALSIS